MCKNLSLKSEYPLNRGSSNRGFLPVMAAIAVRKRVISIGHFSSCYCLQSLQIFCLLEEIKSNCMHWMHWKSDKKRTEPNELDELKYSKSLIQIHLSHLKLEKKTKLNKLSELEYWKTPSQMSSYAHWHAFLYLHAQTSIKTSIHFSDLK